MGLDAVELILEIESEFDIELDTEFASYVTFGDVVDGVYQKITTKTYDAKDYETMLSKLREELKKLVPEQQNFNENTKLNRLIPFWQRYKVFSSLQVSFPLLPYFAVPDIITLVKIDLFLFLSAMVSLGLSIIVPESVQILFVIPMYSIVMVLGVFLLILLCAILLTAFPSLLRKSVREMTIGESAQILVEKTIRLERMTKQECEATLRNIFCKTLSLKPTKITLESKLIEDLHIG
jgi:acyl carrier protein